MALHYGEIGRVMRTRKPWTRLCSRVLLGSTSTCLERFELQQQLQSHFLKAEVSKASLASILIAVTVCNGFDCVLWNSKNLDMTTFRERRKTGLRRDQTLCGLGVLGIFDGVWTAGTAIRLREKVNDSRSGREHDRATSIFKMTTRITVRDLKHSCPPSHLQPSISLPFRPSITLIPVFALNCDCSNHVLSFNPFALLSAQAGLCSPQTRQLEQACFFFSSSVRHGVDDVHHSLLLHCCYF